MSLILPDPNLTLPEDASIQPEPTWVDELRTIINRGRNEENKVARGPLVALVEHGFMQPVFGNFSAGPQTDVTCVRDDDDYLEYTGRAPVVIETTLNGRDVTYNRSVKFMPTGLSSRLLGLHPDKALSIKEMIC